MRLALLLPGLLLLAACGEDDPSSPSRASDLPTATQTFEITPAREPGATVNVVVSFPLDLGVEIQRTSLLVAGSEIALLPSPWASSYQINGQVVSEGRRDGEPGIWELKLGFRNDSAIVCVSCEPVQAEYRLWD